MNVIFRISLRNLIRQKRRNILLGIAIATGTMLLVMANSFSHGISDTVFNRIMKYVTGQVSVVFSEKGNVWTSVFRDGDRVIDIVKKNVPEMTSFSESIGAMARVIGNGRSENMVLVGIDLTAFITPEELKETQQNFNVIKGSLDNIGDTTVENGVVLSVDKAKYLNVGMGDILRVRVTDVNGQNQAARLTVVGLFKPSSAFMGVPIFAEMKNVKRILSYGPHDIGQLYLTIKDPKKNAVKVADRLHSLLEPGLAAIDARTAGGGRIPLMGYRSDTLYLNKLAPCMKVVAGDSAAAFGKRGVLVGRALASALGLRAGDTCTVRYASKYTHEEESARLPIDAVYASVDSTLSDSIVLLNECRFYDLYYTGWPEAPSAAVTALFPPGGSAIEPNLAPEWLLLDRCKTTTEVKKRYKDISKRKWCATTVDVQTMYETASDVIQMEVVLNLITLVAVLILFFIILIGVVNTLRMTIRERTREIGTVRAIGMQKVDVRNSFLLETFLLATFSSIAGTIVAFVAMWVLSFIKLNAADNPLGMLLVQGHLYFLPAPIAIVGYNILILAIATATAYFPSRRAANLAASEALRHYE
jgi:ABC-type lipoprotein release transport system permease subunit